MNPERLALIREALDSDKHPLITMDAADVRALLDAAAERDALRRRLVAVEVRVEDALRHGYDLDPQEIASALALDAETGGDQP